MKSLTQKLKLLYDPFLLSHLLRTRMGAIRTPLGHSPWTAVCA